MVSNIISYTNRLKLSTIITIISVTMLTVLAYGVDVPIPSAEQLGQWPAATLLGAVAMVSSYCSYLTWRKLLEHNDRYHESLTKLTLLLAERPCIIDKKTTVTKNV